MARLAVDEAVDLVLEETKFVNRSHDSPVGSVRNAVMDTLLWELADSKTTKAVADRELRR